MVQRMCMAGRRRIVRGRHDGLMLMRGERSVSWKRGTRSHGLIWTLLANMV